MQIDNVRVYDLKESIVASGLPMKWNYDQVVFTGAAINMPDADSLPCLGCIGKREL